MTPISLHLNMPAPRERNYLERRTVPRLMVGLFPCTRNSPKSLSLATLPEDRFCSNKVGTSAVTYRAIVGSQAGRAWVIVARSQGFRAPAYECSSSASREESARSDGQIGFKANLLGNGPIRVIDCKISKVIQVCG